MYGELLGMGYMCGIGSKRASYAIFCSLFDSVIAENYTSIEKIVHIMNLAMNLDELTS